MIHYPAKHFFEALVPKLEDHEQEIFYRHPKYPFTCNQLGILIIDDEYEMVHTERTDYIQYRPQEREPGDYRYIHCGTALKLVWECYTGTLNIHNTFAFLDGNPLNLTPGNIIRSGTHSKEVYKTASQATKDFKKATIDYMIKKDAALQAKNLDHKVYWNVMQLPTWIKILYNGTVGLEAEYKKKKYTKSESAEELKKKILELHNKGWTPVQIQVELGITSLFKCKYWLKKALG